MANHYRTEGILLEKKNRREADQVLIFFTKDFGKIEILGRAFRKISSKLRPAAELFNLLEIEFIQGKNQKTLTDAILKNRFQKMRGNLEAMAVAYEISQALAGQTIFFHKDAKVFAILKETFEKLEEAASTAVESVLKIENSLKIGNWKLKIIYYWFLWNLFSVLGYEIDLRHCAHCHQALSAQKLYFDLEEGGIICQKCFQKIGKGIPASADAIKVLRLFKKDDWKILSKIKMGEESRRSLAILMREYLLFYKKSDKSGIIT